MRFDRLKRREFITLLGGAAAWPIASRAQQAAMPVIGYLNTASAAATSRTFPSFVQRLSELGWIEGRTVAITQRWAEGRTERFSEIAAELVRLKVDVILTQGIGAAAAKEVTSVIPIVFLLAADPVGTGLVTRRRTSSAANSGSLVLSYRAQRYSMARLRPSSYPFSLRALRNAATRFAISSGAALWSNPITGSAGRCCARVASGHAATPLSSVMNSRRRRGRDASCLAPPAVG
jgi:hypothetical protein